MERRQSWAALRGEHALAVYIDLKSPYAFISIDPTRAMTRAQRVAPTGVRWILGGRQGPGPI